ncbi:TetR/AcrR family transcriptional regulator [Nocardia sp. alder85J]|uniref:TetR/AcrR family transcriptional regulator n=1 Tax=Nocardia sp. alder85J TaxID=2862949 RepID=UPI001CD6CE7A|nr:TetR/AcrR family transcriptional regulator [Nocardia sp. alder85J]MCX4099248.1 TetR/AcrR family transcriptional regulator [Nocardia sp. alder85J]
MSFRNAGSGDQVAEARTGRPRDRAREAEILACALELLGEVGYDGLTFEAVARRARASKATLYRRWETKRDMVVAAVKVGPASGNSAVAVDTGSLRGDLIALCDRLDTTMRSADPAMSLMLLQAGLEDPDLCRYIEESTGPTGAKLPESVLSAAIGRGELPAGAQPFPYEEITGSVLLLRRLNGLPAGPEYLTHLVDTILIPALRASVTTPVPALRAIFS